MQFPITIGLRRSRFLRWALLVLHGAAGAGLLLPAWPPVATVGLLLLLGVSGAVAWRSTRIAAQALRLREDGSLEYQPPAGGEFLPASLEGPASVHPLLTVFRLRIEHGTFPVVVLPDVASPEDFRRLRVWLRWLADFSGQDAAV